MLITVLNWPPRGLNTTESRTAPKPFLSDEQWDLIADPFPHPPVSAKGGRPRLDPLACLEGVLWVLKTGARWQDLPERYPSPSTCHRRHRDWTEAGLFTEAWRRLLSGSPMTCRRDCFTTKRPMRTGCVTHSKSGTWN